MGHFLVERYVSAAGEASLAAETERLSAGANQGVRLLLTLYTPEEESCLHVFDAPSLALVEHTSQQAGVVFDRVAAVINITGGGA
jgi:hypothetical protein